MQQTISILVRGKVQGVFYRQSTREKALALGITGTVGNKPDGSVAIMATGTKTQLEALLSWCRQGPSRAAVTGVDWKEVAQQSFDGFTVLR
jgi:acylphosphatase